MTAAEETVAQLEIQPPGIPTQEELTPTTAIHLVTLGISRGLRRIMSLNGWLLMLKEVRWKASSLLCRA